MAVCCSSLFLCLAVVAGACGGGARQVCTTEADAHDVYVINHGWHVGIVLDRQSVPLAWWPEQTAFPEKRYLEVGWGDSAYYRTPDPGAGITLRAALWPTPSVLHVVGFDEQVARYFATNEVIRVRISRDGLRRLARYVHTSYRSGAPIGPGLYGHSMFFRANGSYQLFNNCNHWAARALETAGCPVAPARSIAAGLLLRQVRRFGEVVQHPGAR